LRHAPRWERYVRVKLADAQAQPDRPDAYLELFRALDQVEYAGKHSLHAHLSRTATKRILDLLAQARAGEASLDPLAHLRGGAIDASSPEPLRDAPRATHAAVEQAIDAALLAQTAARRQALLYCVVLGSPLPLAAHWMGIKDERELTILLTRAKLAWLKQAEGPLRALREQERSIQ